jgi:hypothetical protein
MIIGRNLIIGAFSSLILISCGSAEKKSPFAIKKTAEGIELSEDGNAVFFYQCVPKQASEKMSFNNYLHPVYNLKGEIITEEFPPDHLHHRGIFWAWHQVYLDNKRLGDSWMMENISQDVTDVETRLNKSNAQLKARVLWKSPELQEGKPFIEEETSIIVHRKETNLRKIDFEIVLKPLVQGIQIGGSDDEKGYGGFCVRIKMPEDLIFMSETGQVTPQNLQIVAGSWMDFSASFDNNSEKSGLALLCHQSTPNYPAPWILRQEASMQNVVFPGRERVKLDKPVVLRYRVIIHNGDANSLNLTELKSEYEKMYRR